MTGTPATWGRCEWCHEDHWLQSWGPRGESLCSDCCLNQGLAKALLIALVAGVIIGPVIGYLVVMR